MNDKIKGLLAIASGAIIILISKNADIPNRLEATLLVVSIVNISVGVYLTKGILKKNDI